jgi:hypothetical protein
MLSSMTVLAVEFPLLFLAGPTLFAYTRHRIPPIPALWAVMGYCLLVMLRDPRFDRRRLWDPGGLRQYAPAILGLFAAAVAIGIALVWRCAPRTLLDFPKLNPLLWGMAMLLYPLLSVYPQGIVYRVFVFSRYRDLFGSGWGMVLASAIAFAYVHIVFRNAPALGLTLVAGLLFAMRYPQTGSLVISSCEHALYGRAIFTIGQERWFYHGAVRR